MRVSVVIPTFNSGPLVVEAVSSVLAQSRPPDEVIVVDDGSSDDTAERLKAFGSSVRYVRKENGGVATARNLGVEHAVGDWIAFLDADDVWHPRKLEIQCAAVHSQPDLAVLGAETYHWPSALHPAVVPAAVGLPVTVPLTSLVVANVFVTSTALVRAAVLADVGPFDIQQFGTEDYDLWLRIAQRFRVANLSVALTGYRPATPGSLSKNAARMEAGMRLILAKLCLAGVFRRRPLLKRKALGYFHYTCGYMHHQAGNRWQATRHAAASLLTYPLPYTRGAVRYRFGRLRLFLATAIASLRSRSGVRANGAG